MVSLHYNETDLSFYSQIEIQEVEATPEKYGYLVSWNPLKEVGGYAIYRGQEGTGWELVVTVGPNTHSFQDFIPESDRLFIYKVFATIEGDLIEGLPGPDGLVDLVMTREYDSARQDIMNRTRTQKTDWRSHPDIGADLEQLEGEPNTRETGELGMEMIRQSLTFDGRFQEQDVNLRAVPTSIYNIDFYTILDTDEAKPIVIKKTIDL